MVFGVECPICGMDLVFADANHPPDECADQVAENERQVAAYKAEKAWSEELARRTKHSRRNCGMSPTDIMMPNDKPPVEVQMTEEEQVAGSCRKVTLVSPRIVKAAMDRTQIVGALKQRPASSTSLETNERRTVLIKFAGKTFDNTGSKAVESAAVTLMQEVDHKLVWGDPTPAPFDPFSPGTVEGREGPEILGLKGYAREYKDMVVSADVFQDHLKNNPQVMHAHVSPAAFVEEGSIPPLGAYVAWDPSHVSLHILMPLTIIPLANWKDINGTPGPDFKENRSVMMWYGALVIHNPSSIKIHLA